TPKLISLKIARRKQISCSCRRRTPIKFTGWISVFIIATAAGYSGAIAQQAAHLPNSEVSVAGTPQKSSAPLPGINSSAYADFTSASARHAVQGRIRIPHTQPSGCYPVSPSRAVGRADPGKRRAGLRRVAAKQYHSDQPSCGRPQPRGDGCFQAQRSKRQAKPG